MHRIDQSFMFASCVCLRMVKGGGEGEGERERFVSPVFVVVSSV